MYGVVMDVWNDDGCVGQRWMCVLTKPHTCRFQKEHPAEIEFIAVWR